MARRLSSGRTYWRRDSGSEWGPLHSSGPWPDYGPVAATWATARGFCRVWKRTQKNTNIRIKLSIWKLLSTLLPFHVHQHSDAVAVRFGLVQHRLEPQIVHFRDLVHVLRLNVIRCWMAIAWIAFRSTLDSAQSNDRAVDIRYLVCTNRCDDLLGHDALASPCSLSLWTRHNTPKALQGCTWRCLSATA